MTCNCRVFKNRKELDDALLDRLTKTFQELSKAPTGVMLSGGSTPLPVYQRMAARPPTPADQLHLMFTDDRMVPLSSDDSNYGNTRKLIHAIDLSDNAVLHVNPRLGVEPAAAVYARQLQTFFDNQGTLRLAVLGLGEDGHTCSLFSPDTARIHDRLAIPVSNQGGFDRVSVTAAVLEKAETVLFFVAGYRKAEILKKLKTAPDSIPAGIAVRNCTNVHVWTDIQIDAD